MLLRQRCLKAIQHLTKSYALGRLFKKTAWLLPSTEIIDWSISDNRTDKTISCHFVSHLEHCNAFVEPLAGYCFQYFSLGHQRKNKRNEKWKQFSYTCSWSYENLVLQNQNWELNLAWLCCYKINNLGISGKAEEEPWWFSDQREPSSRKKYQLESTLPCFSFLSFYSVILQTPATIQYVIKRQHT